MTLHVLCLSLFWLVLLDEQEIRQALRDCDLSVSKMAAWLERDRAYLDRQLRGQKALKHGDLHKLPLRFAQWYHFRMLLKVGLPKEVRRGVLVFLAMSGQRRMTRMAGPDTRKERSA
jgi:hypothetical protein